MTVRQFALLGDSLAQGTEGNFETCKGGDGSWAERLFEEIANLPEIGPLLSPGFRGCWLGFGAGDLSGEWTKTGSWTKTVSTDAFDKGPYGFAYYASAGTGDVATYTRPTRWRKFVGWSVEWIDYTSGGSWQYRIDGGTWTNHGQTIANGNALKRFYLPAPNAQTIEFRAYNGSGNAGICLVGVTPYFVDPTTATQGFIGHNLGCNGQKLSTLTASTSGDRLAWFRAVTLGTGSPIANTPNCGTALIHINDTVDNDTSAWNTNLGTINTLVASLGTFGIVSPWECNTGVYNTTQQANYRAQTKTTAAAVGAQVLDLYDELVKLGITGNAATNTAGFLYDLTHQSAALHRYQAERAIWWVRSKFFPTFASSPSTYTTVAKRAAVAYLGKLAAVQYAAGNQIAPVPV